MICSLLLKEWLKLKWYFTAVFLVNIGICVKIFFDIRQQMRNEHAEMVWYQAVHLHTVLYQEMCYLPIITGLVLSVSQFVPEMMGRRMRIALHLPTGRNRMILICLLTGILFYAIVCIFDLTLICLVLRTYFPVEVAVSSLTTFFPWILAGLLSYLGCVTVLLEPSQIRRLFLLFVFATIVVMLIEGNGYGWFASLLGLFFWLIPFALFSVFESGRRFQQRGGH